MSGDILDCLSEIIGNLEEGVSVTASKYGMTVLVTTEVLFNQLAAHFEMRPYRSEFGRMEGRRDKITLLLCQ